MATCSVLAWLGSVPSSQTWAQERCSIQANAGGQGHPIPLTSLRTHRGALLCSGADTGACLKHSRTPESRSMAVLSTCRSWAGGGHCGGGGAGPPLLCYSQPNCVPKTHHTWNHSPPPRQHAISWGIMWCGCCLHVPKETGGDRDQ